MESDSVTICLPAVPDHALVSWSAGNPTLVVAALLISIRLVFRFFFLCLLFVDNAYVSLFSRSQSCFSWDNKEGGKDSDRFSECVRGVQAV